MKRLHIHVGVENITDGVEFYSTLFGQKPSKVKEDYAKWMLEDPRINFAISNRVKPGVDHLGIQVDSKEALQELSSKLEGANIDTKQQGETTCCYAESTKAWTTDPAGISWETFQTTGDSDVYKSAEEKCCS